MSALRMIERRAETAGLPASTCCHTFRATGITAYLENGGTVKNAQAIAAHELPRTTKEVRALVAGTFRRWSTGLVPASLADPETVDQLVILIDTDPSIYLPILRRLVEHAPEDQVLAITDDVFMGRIGARRNLVWLADRLAAFPEYFDDAEVILRRLALAETEPNIGNNATAIWQRLYHIVLSGTAVGFAERLERLLLFLHSDREPVVDLAIATVAGILDSHSMRIIGPAVVAGRIPPEEWRPRTNVEFHQCYASVLSVLSSQLHFVRRFYEIKAPRFSTKEL